MRSLVLLVAAMAAGVGTAGEFPAYSQARAITSGPQGPPFRELLRHQRVERGRALRHGAGDGREGPPGDRDGCRGARGRGRARQQPFPAADRHALLEFPGGDHGALAGHGAADALHLQRSGGRQVRVRDLRHDHQDPARRALSGERRLRGRQVGGEHQLRAAAPDASRLRVRRQRPRRPPRRDLADGRRAVAGESRERRGDS